MPIGPAPAAHRPGDAAEGRRSCRAAACFGASPSVAGKWLWQRRRTGSIGPRPRGGDQRASARVPCRGDPGAAHGAAGGHAFRGRGASWAAAHGPDRRLPDGDAFACSSSDARRRAAAVQRESRPARLVVPPPAGGVPFRKRTGCQLMPVRPKGSCDRAPDGLRGPHGCTGLTGRWARAVPCWERADGHLSRPPRPGLQIG